MAIVGKVWSVIAEDFVGIGKWASNISHSQGFGLPVGDSPHRTGACEITATGFDDTNLKLDATNLLIQQVTKYLQQKANLSKIENVYYLFESDNLLRQNL